MASNGIIKSACGLCLTGCGIRIHVKEGKPVKIEGDPDCPVCHGLLCSKGLASLEYAYHPDRLKHPLKRVGEKGQGRWQQISWDEALDTIAREINRARENHGVESIAVMRGSHKGFQEAWLHRFGNALGTPNLVSPGNYCHHPRNLASVITYGFVPACDLGYPPACIMVWGSNSVATSPIAYSTVRRIVDNGTKLIVVDPRRIELADSADIWLQVRPGADLALALAMINVIINENLYDKDFVEKWTVGFDELKAHVQDYGPEKVAEVTWIEAETIRQAARFYAVNRPACIQWGNALDHGVNSVQGNRAIAILRAITGNLGVPGGEVQFEALPISSSESPEMDLRDKVSAEVRARSVNGNVKLLPLYLDVLPQRFTRSVLQGDPYPIRVAYIQGSNPLAIYSNALNAYEAFKRLEFLAVADLFMTPTAALADIVLPIASYLEYDSIVESPSRNTTKFQRKVIQIGECRSDYEVVSDLSKRLGISEYFCDGEQCLNNILQPSGVSLEELQEVGSIPGNKKYMGYESSGFNTPSGKVELYSNRLKEWGFDPLPIYYEPVETPLSDPELAEEYPLLLTNWKAAQFRHSCWRQISSQRDVYPEPAIQIHPETAAGLNIKEGDLVYIETKRGRIRLKASLTEGIDPRVVCADHGWWFPEKGISDGMYGWAESNVNILMNDEQPFNREIGSVNLRGVLCRVYRALP